MRLVCFCLLPLHLLLLSVDGSQTFSARYSEICSSRAMPALWLLTVIHYSSEGGNVGSQNLTFVSFFFTGLELPVLIEHLKGFQGRTFVRLVHPVLMNLIGKT